MTLVYRDKTFCKLYRKCKFGKECGRALTPEIKKGAIMKNLPIEMFIETPKCFEPKNKK